MKYVLVLQFKATSEEQFDELIELEKALSKHLGDLAQVDGHDFGSGEMNIFILSDQPLAAFHKAKIILKEKYLLGEVKATYRRTDSDNYALLWPEASTERFAARMITTANQLLRPWSKSDQSSSWYKDLGMISIGGFSGGPEDGGIGDMKVDLWKLFSRHCKSTYCPAVSHYALLLAVGGKFQDFEAETDEGLRRNKRDKTIGVKIVIPMKAWRRRPPNQLRDYFAKRVRDAIELSVNRLAKDNEPLDTSSLFGEVDEAIGEFRTIDYEN